MKKNTIFNLTATAVLLALSFVLGYFQIPVGPLRLTLATLPIAVGAIVLGPRSGLLLGTAFGVASFCTCLTTDAFGMFLLNVNPWLTALTCIAPRMLCGWLPGLLYRPLAKHDRNSIWSPALCAVLVTLLNTLLFLSTMWLLFSGTFTTATDYHFATIGALITAAVAINFPIELLINLFVGGAVCKVMLTFNRRLNG